MPSFQLSLVPLKATPFAQLGGGSGVKESEVHCRMNALRSVESLKTSLAVCPVLKKERGT